MDGSAAHAKSYVQFVSQCGTYKSEIFECVVSYLQEVIHGFPGLIKENAMFTWAIKQPIEQKDGMVHTPSCYP